MQADFQPTLREGWEEAWSDSGSGDMFKTSLQEARCAMRECVGHPARAIYTKAGFAELGDDMIRKARARDMPLSMGIFDFKDLLEAQEVYDWAVFRAMFTGVVDRLFILAGKRGLVAHTGTAEFTVVLPGLDRCHARLAVVEAMGHPARVEFDIGNMEILLVPDVEVECVGADVDHAMDFHVELRRDMDDAHNYEHRRLAHITREREWHSRPMEMPSPSAPQQIWAPVPATMPALLLRL
jgi:GGDEF domain-containing protein